MACTFCQLDIYLIIQLMRTHVRISVLIRRIYYTGGMDYMGKFAKGLTSKQQQCKIFYGLGEDVERNIHKENNKYWSISFYNTKEEMERYIEIDKQLLKDEADKVEFIQV
jgi:hypothetical protein